MTRENPLAVHDPNTCYMCGAKNNESTLVRWQASRVICTKKYKSSPYWEDAYAMRGQQGEILEHKQANPDVLTDEALEDCINWKSNDDKKESLNKMSAALTEASKKLSRAQYQIFNLMRHGKTDQEIASILNLAKSTVCETKQRMIKKLQRLCKEVEL